MNRTRVITVICSALMAILIAGCGGGNTGNATISGTVTGLDSGNSVSLTNNGGAALILSNGNFSFPGTVASGDGYKVLVSAQPLNQTCLVTYGSGVIDFAGTAVSNVSIICTDNVHIGTKVAGLTAGNSVTFSLTLQNDSGNVFTATATANGVFNQFSNTAGIITTLPIGTLYNVAVTSWPSDQVCTADSPTPDAPYSGGVVAPGTLTVDFTCKPKP